jgi:hypothetical protein
MKNWLRKNQLVRLKRTDSFRYHPYNASIITAVFKGGQLFNFKRSSYWYLTLEVQDKSGTIEVEKYLFTEQFETVEKTKKEKISNFYEW